VSVKETNTNIFNDACNKCHTTSGKSNLTCSDKTVIKNSKLKIQNCVGCHMPKSGSIDIPHVTVHDHFIRKPITKKDKQALKEFIGLYAINEKAPNNYTRAKAYLNQYEKFEQKTYYLDSAEYYLKTKTIEDLKNNIHLLVQLEFTKKNYAQIMSYVNKLSDTYLLNTKLVAKSFSNEHAWTSYRIAESFYNFGNKERALIYFKKAIALAPFGLDFKNKLATVLASNGLVAEAEKEYQEILNEYPKHVSALTNLGYIKLTKGDIKSCELYYFKALALDPDYEPLLLNLAGYYAYKKDYKQSQKYLLRLLKKNPNNQQAQQALKQINSLL
jgi:tetratricopeptide (TPR) repeat protein